MQEQDLKELASQLRQPHGEGGVTVAEMMNKGNALMNRDALLALDAAPNDNILEIGMGNGAFVKEILSKHDSIYYTGVDFSELMVLEAEKMNAQWMEKGKAVFVHADVTSLPLDNELYSKVFTVNTIYFWQEREKVLAELKRVLQPGGKLFICLRPKWQMEQYPFTQYGFRLYSQEDVTGLLTANGFDIVTVHINKEPDFDFNGQKVILENMVVEAKVR
jgi:ubiquinone/menaquinone biosynthesis C-methylase UbiE